ncbi:MULTISPECIES: glutathione peroxidase [Exiguobacterium]|uniref:glutathione peroxidase n=1 Tax=Exiguobacterium TaxID=33986 RepID=UPI001BEB0B6E|nr:MULTISPECIES: glutathione peroxidase [Exiguobacterium]MCT4792647.1 glutathione peroxidase [Exiguobacterium artemiae]
MPSLYEIEVQDATGQTVSLQDYAGEVLLIVNTASKCGLVGQLGDLQRLYDKYADQGVKVLGFPCDQFNNQEFADQQETMQFCQRNYGVTFPMFQKIDVNGPMEHRLYTYLKQQQGGLLSSNIKWNFTKFLIDRQGRVVKRFAPVDSIQTIEKTLVRYV